MAQAVLAIGSPLGLLIYYARVYGPERLGDQAPFYPLPPRKT